MAQDKNAAKMQDNLELLRKLFGWTPKELADRLDIKKQSVLNLEHRDVTMTRIQYIAIRAIFEAELENRSEEEKTNISAVMSLIFDDKLDISEEKREEALAVTKVFSESTAKDKDNTSTIKLLATTLVPIIGISLVAIATHKGKKGSSFTWIKSLLK